MWRTTEDTIRFFRDKENEGGGGGADDKGGTKESVLGGAKGEEGGKEEEAGKKEEAGKTPTEEEAKKAAEEEGKKKAEEEAKKKEEPAPKVELAKLKLPEGVKAEDVNPELFQKFASIIEDPKLTPQERSQQLMDLHNELVSEAAGAPYKEWETTQENWVKELASNKEYGSGDPKSPLKPEVSTQVGKVIDQLGGDKLRAALNYTGAGNNPVVVEAFVKLSKTMAEGGRHLPGDPPRNEAPKTTAQRLYPHLAEQQKET